MLFCARNKNFRLEKKIICGGEEIEIVHEHTILGVTFSSHLTWDSHVEKIIKNLSLVTGAIARCRAFLPGKIKLQIYNALFVSQISYCSLVWLTTTKTNLEKIYLLQKKAIRHIANLDYLSHTRQAFETFSVLKIQSMYEFRILLSFHLSSSFRSMIEGTALLKQNDHTVNTRNTDTWLVPHFRTDYKFQALQHNLPVILNRYKDINNPTKKALRELFLQK